jgi:hypothetical protein
MKYCIYCTDYLSGQTGCFGIDPEQSEDGKFQAITPVFPTLADFFRWAGINGIKLKH